MPSFVLTDAMTLLQRDRAVLDTEEAAAAALIWARCDDAELILNILGLT